MAISKKFFVDIDLQGNALNNSTIGANSSMTKAGSFRFDGTRLEYFDGTAVKQVANLTDISAVTGGLILQGGYDPTTNTPDIAADTTVLKGFFWVATAVGTFLGESVQVGDLVIAKLDNPGSTAANWLILQGNVVLATETVDGIVRLATQTEVNDGTEGGAVVVTPATLQGKIDAQITPEISSKLPLAGGTMSGAIDMGGNNINGVNQLNIGVGGSLIVANGAEEINLGNQRVNGIGTPVTNDDAANKQYVDDQVATALPLAGGTMSGDIEMDAYNISGVTELRTAAIFVNDIYSRDNVNVNLLVGLDAQNAQTIVNLPAPTNGADAANKDYVDDNTSNKLPLAGGTMSGGIDMVGNNVTGVDYLSVNTIAPVNTNVLFDGGELDFQNTGKVTNLPAPTNGGDATNKTYVDGQDALKLSLTGGTMSGDIDMGGQSVTNVNFVQTTYLQERNVGDGVILASNLNASGNSIINLPTPTNDGDAANKTYVDGAAATAESDANDYTDTQIAQEVIDRNAAINAQSYTAIIEGTTGTSGWTYNAGAGVYEATITHNLGTAGVIATSRYEGIFADFFMYPDTNNTLYIASNFEPSENVIVSIIKAAGNF